VRLLHAKIVRPFVWGNKTDATDTRAIWLAVQQPGIKLVGTKSLNKASLKAWPISCRKWLPTACACKWLASQALSQDMQAIEEAANNIKSGVAPISRTPYR
jgi:hypothetical protein